MQSLTKILPVTILSLAAAIPMVQAQDAVTTPVGAMTYSFPATTQLTSTYISVPLTNQPVFSGRVLTVGTNTLTFEGTPFTAGAFTQAGAPHFLRIQDGPQAGRMVLITANTANTLTVDVTDNSSQTTNLNTTGFAVAVGNQAQVVPGDTLASFFGDNTPGNPVAFVGASGALQADTVGVYNPSTLRHDIYFFSTSLGYWRSNTSTANRSNLVLYPDASLIVARRAGRSAVSLTVVGEVPTVSPITKVPGSGQAVFASSRFPTDIQLSQLNLTNWTSANSALSADTVGVYNPLTLRLDVYFRRLDNTWRRVGDANTNQSGFVIPAGSGIVLVKRAAASGPATFVAAPLPYTL